ncbi:hypothetical protein P7C70_g1573, partial [Phenoliferia sp. Uapishka_3]
MLLNAKTVLVGSEVLLVPYRAEHVLRYHEWMSDPQIREATASEELSLEEEYEMQKLTFIVLRRIPDLLPSDPTFLLQHGVDQMVGDVNVFLSQAYDSDPDSDSEFATSPPTPPRTRCEVELMIAVSSTRRQGFGQAALKIFLSYASKELKLPPSAFFSRIGIKNAPSLALFEKLGFSKIKVVEAFGEVEMGYTGEHDKWGWEPAYEILEVNQETL